MLIHGFNVFNGGSYTNTKRAFQEYFVIPIGVKSFKEVIRMAVKYTMHLKILSKLKLEVMKPRLANHVSSHLRSTIVKIVNHGVHYKAKYKNKYTTSIDVTASKFKVKGGNTYNLNLKQDGLTVINPEKIVRAIKEQYYIVFYSLW